ncbi:MAG: ABC transporter permease, partial [Myxococcales bacterium]|nr:ABC transporter permease [Myxococcales bacterium]
KKKVESEKKLPSIDEDEMQGRAVKKDPLLPPPPPELVGRPGGLPGPFGGDGLPAFANRQQDDGWEDPVEVLGLDAKKAGKEPVASPESPEPRPLAKDIGESDGDGGDGDDWEDPSEVLDLTGGDETGGDETGEPAGDETGTDETGTDETGTDETGTDETGGEGDGDDGDDEDDAEPERTEGIVDPILLGRELANELAVGVGARVQLITPVGRLTPAGRVPGILAAKVGGVFHSGMYEYDRKNVYTPLPVAQAFLRSGDRITGIEVKLHDVDAIDAGKRAIEDELRRQGRAAPYFGGTLAAIAAHIGDEPVRAAFVERYGVSEPQLIVESWKELNRNLFSAMFLEKIAMFVALLFVVLVASFGILASNLMSVLEKSKEIAILKAMGAQDQLIQRVFVAEGLVLGLLGAIGGIGLGLGLCWSLDTFGFPFNENFYYIERLPVVVNPLEVAIVGVAALAIVWLSSIYPARVASRMRPIDGLRQQEK